MLPRGRLQRAGGDSAQLLRPGRSEAPGQSRSDAGKEAEGSGVLGVKMTTCR